MFSQRAERRALFLVALQFFMLVPFIVYERRWASWYLGARWWLDPIKNRFV
jgi:hypothetical protein